MAAIIYDQPPVSITYGVWRFMLQAIRMKKEDWTDYTVKGLDGLVFSK
jgi:hypothetical protein